MDPLIPWTVRATTHLMGRKILGQRFSVCLRDVVEISPLDHSLNLIVSELCYHLIPKDKGVNVAMQQSKRWFSMHCACSIRTFRKTYLQTLICIFYGFVLDFQIRAHFFLRSYCAISTTQTLKTICRSWLNNLQVCCFSSKATSKYCLHNREVQFLVLSCAKPVYVALHPTLY